MEEYYQNKPKKQEKQTYPATKDTIIEQLKAQIQEQAATIELLKQQLTVKDEQIATANKLADQAQQLDLTTHKQQKSLPQDRKSTRLNSSHASISYAVFCLKKIKPVTEVQGSL